MIDIFGESEQINRLLDAQEETHSEAILVKIFLTNPEALLKDERRTVEVHLEVCADCRSLVNFRSDPRAQY